MNYLKDYGINDDEINNITKILDKAEVNIDIFLYNEEKVKSILDLFRNIGVTNLYEIIITSPYMFCDSISSIASKINGYPNKEELRDLLNKDASYLELINLS